MKSEEFRRKPKKSKKQKRNQKQLIHALKKHVWGCVHVWSMHCNVYNALVHNKIKIRLKLKNEAQNEEEIGKSLYES